MKRSSTLFLSLFLINSQLHVGAQTEKYYYTEQQVFQSQPNPKPEKFFGGIGTTGLKQLPVILLRLMIKGVAR